MRFPDIRRLSILSILAFGLAIRLVWALLIPVDPISDSQAYHIFATNIVDHGVYGFRPDEPGAYWAVGTAGIYAFGYMLFGTGSSVSVILLNILSSLVVIWGLNHLGTRWYGPTTGLWAALLFAVWPLAIQFTTVLAAEIHFMALTLAALAAWDRSALSSRGLLYLVVAGILFGAATYVRPIALLIPAALAMATMLRNWNLSWQEPVKAVVATVLIFALVAPWSARNERVFDERVFMSTNFWPNFWMGNHVGTSGGYTPLPSEIEGMTEIERSDYMKELALAHLEEAPLTFVWRTIWKAVRLHERETIGVVWNAGALEAMIGTRGTTVVKAISTGFWYAALVGAVYGIVLLWKSGLRWRVLVTQPVWLWLYFIGVHAVIVVGDRYHMPAIPMIALLAGVALSGGLNADKLGLKPRNAAQSE